MTRTRDLFGPLGPCGNRVTEGAGRCTTCVARARWQRRRVGRETGRCRGVARRGRAEANDV